MFCKKTNLGTIWVNVLTECTLNDIKHLNHFLTK